MQRTRHGLSSGAAAAAEGVAAAAVVGATVGGAVVGATVGAVAGAVVGAAAVVAAGAVVGAAAGAEVGAGAWVGAAVGVAAVPEHAARNDINPILPPAAAAFSIWRRRKRIRRDIRAMRFFSVRHASSPPHFEAANFQDNT